MDKTTLDLRHRQTTETLVKRDLDREKSLSRIAELEESLKTETDVQKYKTALDEVVRVRESLARAPDDHLSYLAKVGPALFEYYDRRSSSRLPAQMDPAAASAPRQAVRSKKTRERRPRNRPPKVRGPGISSFFDPGPTDDDVVLGAIVGQYMSALGKPDHNADSDYDSFCASCLSADSLEVNASDGVMTCITCGDTSFVGIDNDRPSYKEPMREVSYYSYKRLNHFNEWISQVQGKETTTVPDAVLETITAQLRSERISDMSTVTSHTVKRILKRHKLSRYFEHASYICNRLCGVKSPQFSPELEEKLRSMFQEIQAPFLRHSPPNRSNFLSYSYVLHKMLYLLGEDELLPHFPLLKSRFKLLSQENVWREICNDLGWAFYPSI